MGAVASSRPGFEGVYRAHVRDVHRYLSWRLGPQDAEDLTAEVFVRALRGWDGYDPIHATPRPWLLGIAANVISEHRRGEARRMDVLSRLLMTTSRGAETPPPSDGIDPSILLALRRVNLADRETVFLIAWGSLTRQEASEALGVPAGTVRSRLARVRRELNDVIPCESSERRHDG